jgi:hypothetical protein
MILFLSSSNLSARVIVPAAGTCGELASPLDGGPEGGTEGDADGGPEDCAESGARGAGRTPDAGPLGRPTPAGRWKLFGRLIVLRP